MFKYVRVCVCWLRHQQKQYKPPWLTTATPVLFVNLTFSVQYSSSLHTTSQYLTKIGIFGTLMGQTLQMIIIT